jgi:glycosyltransferase involved in cell wall biosynthesis
MSVPDTPGDEGPGADLDAVIAERDRALEDLAATRRMAGRQRARFDERLDEDERLRTELGITQRERDRLRRDLDRLRRNPVVRVGRRVARLFGRTPPGSAPRTPTPTAQSEPLLPVTAVAFRSSFLGALPRVGWSAAAITELELDDVVVLTSPAVGRRSLPGHVVTIAVVDGDVDHWLADPAFDDIDVVLTSSSHVADRLARDTVHLPVRVDGEVGASDIVEALRDWATRPRMAIHIGPLTWEKAAGWGDLPFGRALQRALARQGWSSTLHVYEDRDGAAARRADVALHVFGARAPEPHDGQPALLWVISHPDRISTRIADRYPVVFAGSDLFAALLAERSTARVVPLHQATDPERFYPDPKGPEHEILFVGSSRGFRRRILADLAGTTHEVAVYGGGWTPELLAPHRLTGEWIPNDRLREWYSSAGIVLCDHYDEMRDEGFISNRAYDALASGAFVISDRVPGIEQEFGQGLVTYGDPAELQTLVDTYLADADRRRRAAEVGRQAVLARHTFAHRVATILEEVARLGIGTG